MPRSLSTRLQMSFYLAWLPMPLLLSLLLLWDSLVGTSLGWGMGMVGGWGFAPFASSAYFIARAMPIRRRAWWHILTAFVCGAVIASALWLFLCWATLFVTLEQYLVVYNRVVPELVVFGVMGFGYAGAYFYAVLAQENARLLQETALKAQIAAKESELKALRSQLRPHFLFNSLNSISALVTLDAKRARRMCVALADFLRATLKVSNQDWIPLSEELSLLRSYLAVEQERFGERLVWHDAVAKESLVLRIPSLLLQPLVENAIKHGIQGLPEGGEISLSIHLQDDTLTIELRNDTDFQKGESKLKEGHGLRLTRERLDSLYGRRSVLTLHRTNNQFNVHLQLPVTKEPNHDAIAQA